MSNNQNSYINGIFIEEKEGKYGKYLSIGVTDEGLNALSNLQRSESGFRNFIASPQKSNPAKYSSKKI